jgi:hypothetical protein
MKTMQKLYIQAFRLLCTLAITFALLVPTLAQQAPLVVKGGPIALTSGSPTLSVNVTAQSVCKFSLGGSAANPVSFFKSVNGSSYSSTSTTTGAVSVNAIGSYTINTGGTGYIQWSQAGGGATVTYLCSSASPDDTAIHLAATPLPVQQSPFPPAVSGSGSAPQASLPGVNAYDHCNVYGSAPSIGSSLISMLSCDQYNNLNIDIQKGTAAIVGGYIGFSPVAGFPIGSGSATTCTSISLLPALLMNIDNEATSTQPTLNLYNNSGCTGNPLVSKVLANGQTITFGSGSLFSAVMYYTLSGAASNSIVVNYGN